MNETKRKMKIVALFLLSVLIVLAGHAAATAETGRSVVAITESQGAYGGGRSYLPVRFGGFMGTMRLDTGASTTRVVLAPWNKSFPSIGQSASVSISGQVSRCDDVEAKDVALKAFEGNDIGRAKYVITRCDAGEDLLGLDFFKGTRFALDFQHAKIVFFGAAPPESHPQPFQLLGPGGRLLGIPLRAGATPIVGLFDTGAEVSAVDKQFVQRHKNLFTQIKRKQQAGVAGGGVFAPDVYRLKKLDFGDGRVVKDLYVLVYDFGGLREALGGQSPLVLGYNFLRNFEWSIDFTVSGAPTWVARPQ